ncbi:hypothetical protein GPK34_00710 [Secundilactobacillus kimchicus]|uniref:hypothetical protein n=1 Tax=Secundilactobacillus kimchicus TaxID=528209 RepID=UPI001C0311FA|nr:hypothetical protein [Secundilactobacillus kimchicus]MBT9670559.1 hypothetical protein [Secundilactobacillus kimchicus]
MAIETMASHVIIAKQFKNDLPNLWYAFGRTSPWDSEENPPSEDMYTTNIEEIVGYKHFEKAALVVPTNQLAKDAITDNILTYKGQEWQVASDDEALKYGARYVYLETTVEPDDLPYAVYRQVGVYQGLVPTDAAKNKSALIPTEVQAAGTLLGYDNRLFQRYAENVKLKEKFVLKF